MHQSIIIDLYGTIIDISSDQNAPSLWNKMAQIYSASGADYSPYDLHQAYRRMVYEEKEALGKVSGYDYPEADIRRVFARLLLEAPKHHASTIAPSTRSFDALQDSEWTAMTANVFRILSRRHFRLFPSAAKTLSSWKREGAKLYLLSNAQAVWTRNELEQLGLTSLFEDIFLSSELQMCKPQPEFLERLMKKNHLKKEETILIGNEFDTDMKIASSVGIQAYFLNTNHLEDNVIETNLRKNCRKDSPLPIVVKSGEYKELDAEVRK